MQFKSTQVFPEERFSVGFEASTGQACLSFPVFNGLVEYEEHYAIPANLAMEPAQHRVELLALLQRARNRELDAYLLVAPGRLRGWAC